MFVGSATTSSISVAVKPPQLPGGIRRYKIIFERKKCEAEAGIVAPSCTLTGLAAGTQYNVSAQSVGDDYKTGAPAFGLLNTLPDGRCLTTDKMTMPQCFTVQIFSL